MKLIILRDPLKLDFYESLPGLHGTSILYKKGTRTYAFKERATTSLKHSSLMCKPI